MTEIRVAPATDPIDRAWLADLWRREWAGATMVTRGRQFHVDDLDAVIAWRGADRIGAATYHVDGAECELLSLNALDRWQGVGTALLRAVETAARAHGCHRVWLITTNDNLDALRFYQRRGYRLVALHAGAVDASRRRKPTIPLTGDYGIPLHDEIELAIDLTSAVVEANDAGEG